MAMDWQKRLKERYGDRIKFDAERPIVGLDGRFSESEIKHIQSVANAEGWATRELDAA